MIALERRYRVLLRLLPANYRRQWADDMAATFLQNEQARLPDAEATLDLYGRSYPPLPEVWSLARLAVGVRLGTAGPHPSAVPAAWGAAVRLVALIGLLVPAAFAMAAVPAALLGPQEVPRGQIVVTVWMGAAWIAAYMFLVLGRPTGAKVLAAGALVVTLVASVVGQISGGLLDAALVPYGLGISIPLVALIAWQNPMVRPSRRWLWGLPIAAAILVAVNIPGAFGVLVSWDLPGSLCLAAVVSAVALPAMARRQAITALSCWLAVSLLGGSAALVRGLSLITMLLTPGRFEGWGYFVLGAALQAVAAALVAGIAIVRARRLLRAAPAVGSASR